ncbi:MAG: PAS domain S-box protein, partial [Terriglobus roseus]|nr:PAS domain S-box protein [Terriglobus roseus]
MNTQLPSSPRLPYAAAQPPQQREAARLRGLERMELLETPPDPALEAIVQLCADICQVSAAAITIVRRDAVWFKASVGLQADDMPRADSPCDETIRGNDLFTIPNAAEDEQYAETGIRVGPQAFQFYAGAPLITADGSAIGCLCIYDNEPRDIDEIEANTLRTLAQNILTHFELNLRLRSNEREARTRQRVEAALTVERNFVSAVLDTIGALVVVFDTAGRVVRFNRICETISGYPVEEIVGHTLWDTLVPASDRAEAIDSFTRLREGRFPAAYEDRWLTRDKTSRLIQWTATALTDGHKDVAFIIATGIDVTMQREAEETLRESEGRYRQLIEGSLGAVFTHDGRGILLSINSYGAENLGYSVSEMLGRPLHGFLQEEDRAAFGGYLRMLLNTGEAQGTFDLRHRDGTPRILAFRNRLVESMTGDRYALCFAVDITEKVRAEERLLRLTQQSNSILDSVGDGILGMDLDGACTVCNPAAANMLGYSDDAIATAEIFAQYVTGELTVGMRV